MIIRFFVSTLTFVIFMLMLLGMMLVMGCESKPMTKEQLNKTISKDAPVESIKDAPVESIKDAPVESITDKLNNDLIQEFNRDANGDGKVDYILEYEDGNPVLIYND